MNRELPSPETIAKFARVVIRTRLTPGKEFNISLKGLAKKRGGDYNRLYLRERAKRFRALGLTSKGKPRKHHWWMTATVEERKAHRREYLKIYMRKWRPKRKKNHANSTDGI